VEKVADPDLQDLMMPGKKIAEPKKKTNEQINQSVRENTL
jgi:hypothetical protein